MRAKLKRIENTKKLIQVVDGRKVVYSFEFYKATGLHIMNHTRWLTETVFSIGVLNKDYFPAPGNIAGRSARRRLRHYFELDFAIGLCMVARTRSAMELMNYLKEQKNEVQKGN